MAEQPAALVAAVLFVPGLLRGTVGFGDALLAMPVLVGLVGIRTAIPVVGLAAVVAALTFDRNLLAEDRLRRRARAAGRRRSRCAGR